jgi:hypothetical protein
MKSGEPRWRKFGSRSFWIPAYRKVTPRNARSSASEAGCVFQLSRKASHAVRCGMDGGGGRFGARRVLVVVFTGPSIPAGGWTLVGPRFENGKDLRAQDRPDARA